MKHTLTSPFIEDHPTTLAPWGLKFDIPQIKPVSMNAPLPAAAVPAPEAPPHHFGEPRGFYNSGAPEAPPAWTDEPIVTSPMTTSPKETPMTEDQASIIAALEAQLKALQAQQASAQVARKEAAMAKVKAAAAAKKEDTMSVEGVIQVCREAFAGGLKLAVTYQTPGYTRKVWDRKTRKHVVVVTSQQIVNYTMRLHAFGAYTNKKGEVNNYLFGRVAGDPEWICLRADRITELPPKKWIRRKDRIV